MALALRRHFAGQHPRGYVVGKTRFRDTLMVQHGFSAMRAERLVDQMEALGYLHYRGRKHHVDAGNQSWAINPDPTWVA